MLRIKRRPLDVAARAGQANPTIMFEMLEQRRLLDGDIAGIHAISVDYSVEMGYRFGSGFGFTTAIVKSTQTDGRQLRPIIGVRHDVGKRNGRGDILGT